MNDIEVLEEQLKTYKRHLENYEKEECLTSVYYELKKYAEALENLIKAYKELEERNIYLVTERKKLEELLFMSNENYIEKSLIKEKIEELETKRINFKNDNVNKIFIKEFTRKYTEKNDHDYGIFNIPEAITYMTNNEYNARISELQQLLEEK